MRYNYKNIILIEKKTHFLTFLAKCLKILQNAFNQNNLKLKHIHQNSETVWISISLCKKKTFSMVYSRLKRF